MERVGTVSSVTRSYVILIIEDAKRDEVEKGQNYGVFRPSDGLRLVCEAKIAFTQGNKIACTYSEHDVPKKGDIAAPLPSGKAQVLPKAPERRSRYWTDTKNRRIKARLVGPVLDKIELEFGNSETTLIKWQTLSDEDIEYLASISPSFRPTATRFLDERRAERERTLKERRRREREQRIASARSKIVTAVIADWYAKQRKASVNDVLDGRGPSENVTLGEAIVNALAYKFRDSQVGSAIRDLYPEMGEAEVAVLRAVITSYINGKDSLEELESEAIKEWTLQQIKTRVKDEQGELAGHLVEFTEFIAVVHEEVAKNKKQ